MGKRRESGEGHKTPRVGVTAEGRGAPVPGGAGMEPMASSSTTTSAGAWQPEAKAAFPASLAASSTLPPDFMACSAAA